MLFDVDAHKGQRMLAVPEHANLRAIDWQDDHTLLLSLGDLRPPGGGSPRVIAQDVSGATGQQLGSFVMYVVAPRISKPNTVIMATAQSTFVRSDLMEVDTHSGAIKVLRRGEEHTTRWIVDPDGQPVAREDWDWYHRQYRVYSLLGAEAREILRRDDTDPPVLGGLLPDHSGLVLLAANGRSHQGAWALPLDGSPLKLLAEDPKSDITAVYSDRYTGSVVGVYASGEETAVHWLDPAAQSRFDSLTRAFAGKKVEPYGWTADGTRTLARVSTPSSPPVYYLIDYRTHHADIAAEEYPALADMPLGEMRQISYKAHDGTEIPAYLTLPVGKGTALPLVVLPHGGPNARDFPVFDPVVQFLATRGYAVLQPQFRGSTGFGDAFRDAGDRQWGGLMQDDLTDGVRALTAQGIADPHRVCIVGMWPYGGYAALAGVAFTPELYACAVSVNGIADLAALMKQVVPAAGLFVSTEQSSWKKRVGGYFDSRRASPINAVSSINKPVLIVSGGDAPALVEQSQAMARALQQAGKDVTVVNLSPEVEWHLSASSRVEVLEAVARFLGAHLQRDSPPPAP